MEIENRGLEAGMQKTIAGVFAVLLTILAGLPNATAGDPYETSWSKEMGPILGGIGLTSLGLYLENEITPLTEREVDSFSEEDVNWLDRGACSNWSPRADRASTLLATAFTLSPLTLFLCGDMRDDAGAITTMYLETLLLTVGTARLSKGLAARTRPAAYNRDVPMVEKTKSAKFRKSFYSQHTALASSSVFFLATVYSAYHSGSKWEPYVWGGALCSASLVGYLRIKAGMHFPTDVLVGALIGGFTGYLVPRIHENHHDSTVCPSCDTHGLKIRLNFRF